ncbi:MAG: rhomboid family intramembrane serine protease [Alphaproteobacteria bacterium]|nr:rhomboid family intramembrane serine protease [Alphaproteobacteria bacterium]MBU0859324.1 rhomboid family intramembrane serine protease [Alphaproteobacteria bacterium]
MSNDNGRYTNGSGGDHHEPDNDNIVRLPTAAERAWAAKLLEKERRRQQRPPHEPMINLPPVTKIILGLFIVIHLVLQFGIDDVERYRVFEHFGFVAGGYSGNAPVALWSLLLGPFTYMFLHGNWMHLIMNGAMMMAFGTGCERWMGGRRFLVLFILCGLASAFVQFLFDPASTNPVIGASGGLSGLFAVVLLMMQERGLGGTSRFGIWPFIIIWIGISVIFGLMGAPGGGVIAWPAHIGGFLSGFLFFKPVMRFVR